MKRGAFMLFVVMIGVSPAIAAMESLVAVEVVDGDTILVDVDGIATEADVAGIDAPELNQPFGQEAKAFMESMVFADGAIILWDEIETDKVTLAGPHEYDTVFDGQVAMVSHGLAWPGTGWITRFLDRHVPKMNFAQITPRGLWAAERRPIEPWIWREVELQMIDTD